MEEKNAPEVIKVIGEQGEEILMKLQEIVNVDGKDYALLSIVNEDTLPSQDNDDDELILMKMNKTEDDCTFEVIEDDEEFNYVTQAINEADELEDEEV